MKLKSIVIGLLIFAYQPLFAQNDCEGLEKQGFKAGSAKEAIDIWTKIIENDCPKKELALNNRGMIYLWNYKEYESALADFNKGLLSNPNEFALLVNKGNALGALKRYDESVICLKKAINIAPKDINAYVVLAGIYGDKRDFDSAFKSIDDALKIDSSHFQAIYVRSQMCRALGDDEGELKYLTMLVERNPKSAKAWEYRGYYYYEDSEDSLAIADYSKAIVLNPKDFRLYMNRGLCYGREGDEVKEMKDYTTAIAIKPNYLAYYNRGRRYLKNEEYQKAIDDNDKVIELRPEYPDAYLNKGNALFHLEKYKEAEACYKKGLSFNPQNGAKGKLEYQLENVQAILKKH